MNNVTLIGRLTRDPEIRYTAETTNAICSFTLAVDRNLSKEKRAEAESQGQPTADFIRIVTWGRTAELCGNYLAKGRLTAVQGTIQTGSYTNKDGQRVYTTDVIADRVEFLEWGEKKEYSEQNKSDLKFSNEEPEQQQFEPYDSSKIPF